MWRRWSEGLKKVQLQSRGVRLAARVKSEESNVVCLALWACQIRKVVSISSSL